MKLFSKKISEDTFYNPNARIKVLGSGCAKCKTLEKNVKLAVENLKSNDEVTHLKDIEKIIGYGVMSTPALVIDEKVVSSGKVLSAKEIEKLL
ncbi:MAG: thioredoxin family protein [Pleomorphochaeta sp.]